MSVCVFYTWACVYFIGGRVYFIRGQVYMFYMKAAAGLVAPEEMMAVVAGRSFLCSAGASQPGHLSRGISAGLYSFCPGHHLVP